MNGWGVGVTAAVLLVLFGATPETPHSASPIRVLLDWGSLVIQVAQDTAVTKHRMNFETDEYIVGRRSDRHELLRIIVGGGAYNLQRYSEICLNHKRAWRLASPRGVEIIVGEPGVNALSASYENLSVKDASIAGKIMESINFHDGRYCR
jgi:hypothetical protein